MARLLSDMMRASWWVLWRALWVGVLAALGLSVYWALDTLPAAKALTGSFMKCDDVPPAVAQCVKDPAVEPDTAGPGDRTLTTYQIQFLRTDCTLFFVRETQDAQGWTWPTTAYVSVQPKNTGIGQVRFTMVIPMDASAGPASFASRYGWYCNPVHWAFRGLRELDLPVLTITIERD